MLSGIAAVVMWALRRQTADNETAHREFKEKLAAVEGDVKQQSVRPGRLRRQDREVGRPAGLDRAESRTEAWQARIEDKVTAPARRAEKS